jgi:hypothetical protein
MQQIFYTTVSPKEYHQIGKNFFFPVIASCPNPACLVSLPPEKHGFYDRNVIDEKFEGRIMIRRYYCKYCGKTVSFLPSFCLPYFQYTIEMILTVLCYMLDAQHSLRVCLQLLKHLHWSPAHLQFYVRRFLTNLKFIKIGLRQLLPRVDLPEDTLDKKEGARKILHIVTSGFPQIQTFSTRFFAQCGRSFMATRK